MIDLSVTAFRRYCIELCSLAFSFRVVVSFHIYFILWLIDIEKFSFNSHKLTSSYYAASNKVLVLEGVKSV